MEGFRLLSMDLAKKQVNALILAEEHREDGGLAIAGLLGGIMGKTRTCPP